MAVVSTMPDMCGSITSSRMTGSSGSSGRSSSRTSRCCSHGPTGTWPLRLGSSFSSRGALAAMWAVSRIISNFAISETCTVIPATRSQRLQPFSGVLNSTSTSSASTRKYPGQTSLRSRRWST